MINDRQAFLLQWLHECCGLFDDEVHDLGQPGDREALDDLANKGLISRGDGGFFPGEVHA